MTQRLAQVGAVIVVLALLGVLLWKTTHNSAGKIASDVDNKREIVPAFPFDNKRVNASGKLTLASLRGKVVVLNFWQSYCPPCKTEAPVISAVSKKWAGKDVVFVGVDEQDLPGPATGFMKKYGITYPNIADDGPLVGHFGVTGFPETFFIDKRGRVIPMPRSAPQGHIVGPATPATLDLGIKTALAT